MSQVRKFQTGGTTPVQDQTTVKKLVPGRQAVVIEQPTTSETPVEEGPKSYIILDGEKFENTEENRQKIRNYFARVADPNGGSAILNQISQLADKAATEGGSLVYNTPGNQFSYLDRDGVAQNIDWEGLNERQEERLGRKRSWLGKVIDAYTNSDVQRSARDIYKLGGLRSAMKDVSTPAAADTSNLLNIGNGGWWDYLKDDKNNLIKDENGNLKYDINSAENARLQTMIQRALTAVGMTPEDAKKHFSWDNGAFKNGFDELKSVMGNDPETWKANLNAVLDKVEAGNSLSPEDMSILRLFGITPDAVQQNLTPEQQAALAEQAVKEKWKTAGLEGMYDKAHTWFDLGDDNVLSLNDAGVEALTGMDLSRNGGYELNDQWIDYLRAKGIDPTNVEFLNGYTLYNGKLYKTSTRDDANSALANIYRTSGYYDKNSQNLYGDAQKIINSMWGNPYEWKQYDPNYYSKFLYDNATGSSRGYYYRSENGRYKGLEPGQQLVSYYDKNAKRDSSGFITDDSIRFTITDKDGNPIEGKSGLTKDQLAQMGITPATRADQSTINYGDPENVDFNQLRLLTSVDPRLNQHYGYYFGTQNEYAIYRNPMKSPNLNDASSLDVYEDPKFQGAFVIPPTLSALLFADAGNGLTRMNTVMANPKLLEKLQKILEEFSKTRDATGLGRVLSVGYVTFCNLLEPLGCSKEEINTAFTEWMDMNKDPNKMTKYVVAKPQREGSVQSQKQGGTIPKYQPGGGFGKVSTTNAGHQKNGTKKVQDTRKSSEIDIKGKWSWDKLTTADKADLIGLGADMAAIALGSVPVAGGVVGLGGTGLGLYADIKRDGFQWRDLGNAGISLAGDALSFLPGAGSGVQAAKFATKIKKVAKPLMQILSMYGAVSAIPLVDKLHKTGSLTAQEWRQLATGIAGSINAAKSGKPFAKNTKTGDKFKDIDIKGQTKDVDLGEGFTLKPRDGVDAPNITLTKAQVDEINAITDPLHRAVRAKELAWQSYKDNWDPAKGPIGRRSEALAKYDFSPYYSHTKTAIVANDGENFVIKNAKDPSKNLVFTKDEIDRINSSTDPVEEMRLITNTKFTEDAKYVKYRNSNPDYITKIKEDFGDEISFLIRSTPGGYKVPDLVTNGHLISKKTNADLKLENADIKRITDKSTPAEQQAEFIKVVQEKSGNNTLDSIDKIKDEYEGIENFFEKKRGKFEWRHPIESTKKKDSFNLGAEKEEVAKPVHGLGFKGAFGFRDWWNGQGTTRFVKANRANFLDPDAILRSHRAVQEPGTNKTKTGTNWWSGQRYISRKTASPIPMHLGNANPYEDDPSWRIHLFPKSYNTAPAWGYNPEEDLTNETPSGLNEFTDEAGNTISWNKKGGVLKAEGGSTISGFDYIEPKKLKTPDPQDIAEFSKYLINLTNSNKMLKLANSAYDNMPRKQAMTYTMPTFTDNGLMNAGNEVIKEINNRQPADFTSDANINNFVRKGNQEKATEYQNKLNAQLSGLIGQYNQKNREIENKNRASQLETAYDNQMQGWKVQQMKSNNKQATLAANNQSLNNLFTYGIGKLATQQAKADALKDSFNTAFTSMDAYRNLVKDDRYQQTMDAFNTYKKSHADATFSDWIIGDGASYANAYEAAQKEASAKAKLNLSAIDLSRLGPYAKGVLEDRNRVYNAATEAGLISSAKSGGTISVKKSNYRPYRDYREQIEIDNNKEIRKAINQLNKNTQQLLLKMLK